MCAQAIVLAGPSGAGKSRLAKRLGLPVLRLDDYYRDGTDPALPQLDLAGGEPIEDLCRTGSIDAPVFYEFSSIRRTGLRVLDLGGSGHFVAERIFASEVAEECTRRDLVADALCVTQHPFLTFVRRHSPRPPRAPQDRRSTSYAEACTSWPASER